MELIHGQDNEIREVKVLFKGQVNRRTVDKLIPLEVSDSLEGQLEELGIDEIESEEEEVRETQVVPDVSNQSESVRPRRRAAVIAEHHRRELIEQDLL